MKYILDKTVTYRTEDGALWHESDSENKVVLTATASRLLWILIEHQGLIVTREFLLEKVWDNFGLEPSNNSLTQYISLIRRALSRLGLPDDTIQTRPKVGFILNATLDIKCLPQQDTLEKLYISDANDQSRENVLSDNELKTNLRLFSPEAQSQPLRALKTRSSTSQRIILWTAVVFLIFLLHLIISFIVHDKIEVGLQKENFYTGDIDTCPLYTTRDYQGYHIRLLSITRNILNRAELSCTPTTIFYLHLQERVLYGGPGKVFLTACQQDGDNLLACKGYYDNEWI